MTDGSERWITPAGDVVYIPALLVDRVRNRVIVDLDVFHILLQQVGYIRVDNLDPTQIRDE